MQEDLRHAAAGADETSVAQAAPARADVLGLMENEVEVARRAAGGDEDALCELLRVFGPVVRDRLKGKIAAHWRSALDEDDVMQVTYLEAFLLFHQFKPRGQGSFAAWLSQVAENNLRDALRGLQAAKRPDPRRRLRVNKPNQESFVALVEMLGATEATPSRVAAADEAVTMLESALESLPPDYERVVRLYDLEGLNAAEVGAQLGRSTGAIYMLRARAHERLRQKLGSSANFFSDTG